MDWVESAHILANNAPPGLLGGVSALAFDPFSELLWVGTASGHVASHYSTALQRYTAFLAQGSSLRPTPVKTILFDERDVYTAGADGIKSSNRRGVGKWNVGVQPAAPTLSLASMCFSPINGSSEFIAGGASQASSIDPTKVNDDDVIMVINKNSGSVVRTVPSEVPLHFLRRSARYLCTGTALGQVQLRDTRSLKVQHRLPSHPGGIVDMQAEGNLIYSLGWTVRHGHPAPEQLVRVYDIRTLQPLAPIPFAAPGGPAMLQVHPKLSTTVFIASSQGHWQMIDINNPGDGRFHQINTASFLTSMAVSPSGDYLAFGEADGAVRLWSCSPDTSSLCFSPKSSAPPEGADVPEQPDFVSWTAETPLSSIGMPYYTDPLLSGFEADAYHSPSSPLFNLPPKIDPLILSTMRTVDFVGYAALPRHLRGQRNMVVKRKPLAEGSVKGKGGVGAGGKSDDRRRVGIPLFRSEKEKDMAIRAAKGQEEPAQMPSSDLPVSPGVNPVPGMPSYYRVKTIQYSKFGVEDFDFAFYNKTRYSGLETHIQNSYANAYLQALHYLRPFRAVAKAHMYGTACAREQCFLCEAGFLFRMLEDAQGANCQATNFLKALGSSKRAASLGLMDKEDSPGSEAAYSNLIQHLNRFLLDTTATEAAEASKVGGTAAPAEAARNGGTAMQDTNPVSQLLRISALTTTTCGSCGASFQRANDSHVVDLIYPRKPLSNEPTPPSDFASILRNSLVRESYVKALCRSCNVPNAPLRSQRLLRSRDNLPQALSINTAVHTGEQLGFWLDGSDPRATGGTAGAGAGAGAGAASRKKAPFLPPRIELDVSGSDVKARSIWRDEDMPGPAGSAETGAVYTLRAIVVQIQAEGDAPHLCAIVRVREAEEELARQRAEGEEEEGGGASTAKKNKTDSPWYLFNDFLVRGISEQEALSFSGTWKVPAVLFFEREDVASPAVPDVDVEATADTGILCEDLSISDKRDPALIRHRVLDRSELPTKGTLVAIDAEFVALNQEETEVRSDGTRSVLRPVRLTLARVSVLRGQGPDEGKAFIDEHIYTHEPVMDYLTQFSGIVHGDLDPATSRHTLVPLKRAYKKLRLLVDLGCVFIGHGLQKDFRIINIHVPSSQVFDTVKLYHSTQHPRKLSLRFLSWFLLKRDIQASSAAKEGSGLAEEGHDSIEDADAALRLYNLYRKFEEDGRVDDVLDDIYAEGRRVNWKPPSAAIKPSPSSATEAAAMQAPTLALPSV